MKSLANKILILSAFFSLFSIIISFSQTPLTTKISYEVISGPVFPIDGESLQITGKIALDDITADIQSLSFTVPLISFLGSHGGYLAWLGNERRNPDMNFKSTSINRKGDRWEVKGQLEFRRRFKPVTLNIKREDKNGQIVLNGDFQISTSDYFIGPTPSDLIANWIPFKITMVFDNPGKNTNGEALNTN